MLLKCFSSSEQTAAVRGSFIGGLPLGPHSSPLNPFSLYLSSQIERMPDVVKFRMALDQSFVHISFSACNLVFAQRKWGVGRNTLSPWMATTCAQYRIWREHMEYILESFRDASPAKHWLAMIIFKSRLYFDIKSPPIIGSPTIGGHFKVRVFFFIKK